MRAVTEKQELAALRRKVKEQGAWLRRLARAFVTHVRTDLAPDAALPAAKALALEIERGTSAK